MKKALRKRYFTFAIVFWLSFNTLFASVAYAKEYEDKYATNSLIESRLSEDYGILYEVNNHSQTNQSAILYFVVQDYFNVIHNDFYYKFHGKFDENEEYSTAEFEFDLGMPSDYNPLNEVMLGDEKAILCQAQIGIYPGYYHFYNNGYNYLARSSKTACFIKTLSPNFVLTEEDRYSNEFYVEVGEAENPILYAIVGEKEWIEKVEKDFEAWAKEYDEKLSTTVKEDETAPEPTEVPNSTPAIDEESDEQKAILSKNPRHYEEIKNDEAIEDVQYIVRKVLDKDTGEELGSVTYVAVDGLGSPNGFGGHAKGCTITTDTMPNKGYRFVNLRTNNVKFLDVKWDDYYKTYCYHFLAPESDVTIYFYYEPKDYSITVDELFNKYFTVQPYADEGDVVTFLFNKTCPFALDDLQVLLDDGTSKDFSAMFSQSSDGILSFEMLGSNIKIVHKYLNEMNEEYSDEYFNMISNGDSNIKLDKESNNDSNIEPNAEPNKESNSDSNVELDTKSDEDSGKSKVWIPIAGGSVVVVAAAFVGVSRYKKKK